MVRWREKRGAEQRRALTGPALYVLWQGRRRCYVGQTSRLEMRLAGHRAALLLGARLEVRLLPPGTTKAERERLELELARSLRRRGVKVVGQPGAPGEWSGVARQPTNRKAERRSA